MPVLYHNSFGTKLFASSQRVFLILLVGFVMLFLGQTPFAEEGKQSEAEKKEELEIFQRAKEEFINEEQITIRKALLTKQLFQNRRDQIYFKRAKEALQKKNPKLALKYLQYLLSIKSDQFVWDDNSHLISSLRKEIGKLILSQGGKLLSLYEEKYDGEAANLLQDAKASHDFSKYHEIVQRFFYTKAGFDAVNQIAIQQFDRGYFGEAARMWNTLITSPPHQQRVTSTFLLRTAIAYQRAGDNKTALQIVKRMKRKPAYLKKQKLYKADVIALLQSNRFTPEKQLLASDWKISGGSPLRHRRVHASAPFLKAHWVSPLENKEYQEALQQWEGKQKMVMKPTAVQSNAVVSGDKIIVRTLRGIECRQLSTGKIIWKFRVFNNAGKHALASPFFVAKNGCLGGFSSSHQTVYAIDDIEFTMGIRARGIQRNVKTQNETNRLIALSLSPKNLSHSPSRPFIQWSIGGKPGIPIWFYRKDYNGDHVVSQREFAESKQAFQKLDTNSNLAISQEEAAASSPKLKPHPLANHFFLGPPLPVGDKLFVMTYYDGVISLNILQAETGHLISQQETVILSGEMESIRMKWLLQGVQMSYADGVVVCPVLPDLLVGIDATQGKLLWVSDKLSKATNGVNNLPFGRKNLFSHTEFQTHSGYPSMPLIEGNRIYHLPRGSSSIYCFDLFTGKKIWSARRDGAQYLAAITDKTLFVVGNKHYKSLDKTTGETIWKKPTSIPSGTGIFTGKHYLLPLQEGRVATIDVRTGETFGIALLPDNPVQREKQTPTSQSKPSRWSPGNLIATGGAIISTNLHEAAIFPQVDLLRQQLAQKKTQSSLSVSDHLVLAELNLLSGNTQGSQTELKSLVMSQLNSAQVVRARKIQREILYFDLKKPSNNPDAILAQLDRFSKTPAERGRYLMQKGEIRLQQKDFTGLMRTTTEYAQLPLTDPLPVIGDPTMLVSARSWIPKIIHRAKQKLGADVILQNRHFVNKEIENVLSSNKREKLEQFLYVYNDWAEAAAVRQQLSQMVLKQGEYQRAEFLLLKNSHSKNKHIAANATYLLFKLYQQLGLPGSAARMVSQIEKKYSTITLFEGVTGRQFIKQFPRDSLVWNCYQQQQPLTWNVQQIAITEKGWFESDPKLEEVYSQYRRIVQVPASFPFTLFEKRKGGSNQLAIIDRATGVIKGEFPTGAMNSQYPQLHHLPTEGHFFPMAGADHSAGQDKIGVSLLQLQTPKPLWRKKSKYYTPGSSYYKVGPSGISFATFQSSRQLIVLDPATGDLLWSRKKLPKQSGLHFNAMYGLIGDDKVLVLFHGSHYIIYNTQTGEEIRKGTLSIFPGVRPHVFGRKLLFQKIPYGHHKGELVLWDPIDDKNLLSQFSPSSHNEYESKLHKGHKSRSMLYKIAVTPENELVTLNGNRLQIFDVKNKVVKRKIKVLLPNTSASKVQYLRAFQQGGVYFINIQTSSHGFEDRFRMRRNLRYARFRQTATSDTLIPAIHLQGDLIAIDAKTSKVLWKKTVGSMSILQIAQYPLPFLITMARLRNKQSGNQQSLSIEIIDVQTGETIGKNDNLFSDRIVQLTYNREKERLELYGLKTRIDLDFSRRQQRLAK